MSLFSPGGFADQLKAQNRIKSAFAPGGFADQLKEQNKLESAFAPGGFADQLRAQTYGYTVEEARERRRRLMQNLPPSR